VSRALACVLKHPQPAVAHRCVILPRPSALCGCINFPGKQVNAVWGRYPTACTTYVEGEKTLSLLGARRQNLSRLRGVPAVAPGVRSPQLAHPQPAANPACQLLTAHWTQGVNGERWPISPSLAPLVAGRAGSWACRYSPLQHCLCRSALKMPFRPIGAPFTFFNTRNCSW
jgi:hypothetical protein